MRVWEKKRVAGKKGKPERDSIEVRVRVRQEVGCELESVMEIRGWGKAILRSGD